MQADHQEKARNAARIARIVWRNPLISRGEIAARLGLERSTVTVQVKTLLEAGLVREVSLGRAGPSGGRRPVHLAANEKLGCFIGLALDGRSWIAVVADAAGSVQRVSSGTRRAALWDAAALIDAAAGAAGRDALPILGIGAAAATASGCASRSSAAELSEKATRLSGVPVIVEGAASCLAAGALAFGPPTTPGNFVLVFLGDADSSSAPAARVDFAVARDGALFGPVEFASYAFRGRERDSELVRRIALLAAAFSSEAVIVAAEDSSRSAGLAATVSRDLEQERGAPLPVVCPEPLARPETAALAFAAAALPLERYVDAATARAAASRARSSIEREAEESFV